MKWEFKENHTFGKDSLPERKRRETCMCVCLYSHTFLLSLLSIAEVRCAESAKIRGKYQDRIPVRTQKRDISRDE